MFYHFTRFCIVFFILSNSWSFFIQFSTISVPLSHSHIRSSSKGRNCHNVQQKNAPRFISKHIIGDLKKYMELWILGQESLKEGEAIKNCTMLCLLELIVFLFLCCRKKKMMFFSLILTSHTFIRLKFCGILLSARLWVFYQRVVLRPKVESWE